MKRLFVLLSLLAACGSEEPIVPEPPDTSLIPVAIGNRWTYKITDSSGIVSSKVQTVVGTATVSDGRTGFIFETERQEERGTRSVQLVEDGRLLRAREETLEGGAIKARFRFTPYALRINSNQVTQGDVYSDVHSKIEHDEAGEVIEVIEKNHTFIIEAESEFIDVPAGTFECVRVLRQREGAADKIYWYAPGLGKVKEIGGQVEELERVELADG